MRGKRSRRLGSKGDEGLLGVMLFGAAARKNIKLCISRTTPPLPLCLLLIAALVVAAITLMPSGLLAEANGSDDRVDSGTTYEYVLSCTYETLGVHTHDASCYDSETYAPTCGWADYVIHEHDAACYDANGSLVCQLPVVTAHAHADACYESEWVVADAGHTHDTACYNDAGELTCGQEERAAEGYTKYNLTCQETQVIEHAHTDACYDQGVLVCALPVTYAHQHSDACFSEVEVEQVIEETEKLTSDNLTEDVSEGGETGGEESDDPAEDVSEGGETEEGTSDDSVGGTSEDEDAWQDGFPVAVADDDGDDEPDSNYVCTIGSIGYASLADALSAVSADDTIALTQDVASVALTVTSGMNFTLDLAGHVLSGNGKGSVITVESGGVLNVIDSVRTTLHKGVLTDASSVTVSGTDTSVTVGRWVHDDGAADDAYAISGGVITGGAAGVYVAAGGTFTMTGGTIAGNVGRNAPSHMASALAVCGTAVLANVDVKWNYAGTGNYHATVMVDAGGSLTMTGGEVSGNRDDDYAGAVYVGSDNAGDSALVMSGTVIKENGGASSSNGNHQILLRATGTGTATATLNRVTVGGTVRLGQANSATCTLNIGGWTSDDIAAGSVVTAGIASGKVVRSGTVANLVVNFTDNPELWTMDSSTGVISYKEPEPDVAPTDADTLKVCKIGEVEYTLAEALSTVGKGETIVLTQDAWATSGLIAKDGQDFTLDLAGHVLTGVSSTPVITVESGGAIRIVDSDSQDTSHKGTLVNSETATVNGAAVTVGQWAFTSAALNNTYTITGGVITGGAGGVLVEGGGTFTMTGGTIAGNNTAGYTGSFRVASGVLATGAGASVTLENVDVKWNYSNNSKGCYGGTVAVDAGGCLQMTGGTVLGNRADGYAGTVYAGSDDAGKTSTLTMNGTVVKENGGKATGNGNHQLVLRATSTGVAVVTLTHVTVDGTVRMGQANNGDCTLNIDGWQREERDEYAGIASHEIVVSSVTDKLSINLSDAWWRTGTASTGKAGYVIGSSDYIVPIEALTDAEFDGSVVCAIGDVQYQTLGAAFSAALLGDEIDLLVDLDMTSGLTVESDMNFTLDLNGHVLQGVSSVPVFTVQQGATLKIVDSAASTEHVGKLENTADLTAAYGTAPTVGTWVAAAEDDADATYTIAGGVITGGSVGVLVEAGGTFTMTGGTIAGNSSAISGTGLRVLGTAALSGVNVKWNRATGTAATTYGGGVYVGSSGVLSMEGGAVEGNACPGGGAGIMVLGEASLSGVGVLNNAVTQSGTDRYGGGLRVEQGGSLAVTGGSVSGNFSGGVNGLGAVYAANDKAGATKETVLTMTGTVVGDNGGWSTNSGNNQLLSRVTGSSSYGADVTLDCVTIDGPVRVARGADTDPGSVITITDTSKGQYPGYSYPGIATTTEWSQITAVYGFQVKLDADGWWETQKVSGNLYNIVRLEAVCSIGGTEYPSLAAAQEALVQTGESAGDRTITLLADASLTGFTPTTNLVIDPNGHALSGTTTVPEGDDSSLGIKHAGTYDGAEVAGTLTVMSGKVTVGTTGTGGTNKTVKVEDAKVRVSDTVVLEHFKMTDTTLLGADRNSSTLVLTKDFDDGESFLLDVRGDSAITDITVDAFGFSPYAIINIEKANLVCSDSSVSARDNSSTKSGAAHGVFCYQEVHVTATNCDFNFSGNGKNTGTGESSGIRVDSGSVQTTFVLEGGSFRANDNALNGIEGVTNRDTIGKWTFKGTAVELNENGKQKGSGGSGDGLSYGYVELIAVAGAANTFKANGNSDNGVSGGIASYTAFDVQGYKVEANNNGDYGIYVSALNSGKSASVWEDGTVTANGNGLSGIVFAVQANIKDTSVTANKNDYSGLVFQAGSSSKSSIEGKSALELQGNQCNSSLIPGAFVVKWGTVAVSDTTALTIGRSGENEGNKGSGVYVASGATLNLYGAAGSVITENGAGASYGGGIYSKGGTVTLGSNIAVYNNSASTAGDDIYTTGSNATFTLPSVVNNLTLSQAHRARAGGYAISGWYDDASGARWNADNGQAEGGIHADEVEVEGLAAQVMLAAVAEEGLEETPTINLVGEQALKAAYGTGDLTIEEFVLSDRNDKNSVVQTDQSFTVKVVLYDRELAAAGVSLASSYDLAITGPDGSSSTLTVETKSSGLDYLTLTFELANGASAYISDLPLGLRYRVVEVDSHGYSDWSEYYEDDNLVSGTSAHYIKAGTLVAELFNVVSYELPNTGSIGTGPLRAVGLLCLLAAGSLAFFRARSRSRMRRGSACGR